MKNFRFLTYGLSLVVSVALLSLTSCEPEDHVDPPILVEDGFYLSGPATRLDGLQVDGMMFGGRVEGEGFASLPREGMYEKFFYLSAGTFNIEQVAGAARTLWGWDAAGQQTLNLDGTQDQIRGTVFHGAVVAGGTAFTVDTAGIYHIILDVTTSRVWFTRITHWGAIGDATELGWSGQYMMGQVFANADSAKWEAEGVIIRERGGIKFRYNDGWKITLPEFIIFANIGNENNNFVMGGGTFAHPTPEGVYTITLRWSLEDGWSHTFTRTGNVEPLPLYPAELFMIGDGIGGWDWALNGQPMIPVHSKPHLFWRIQWLEATGGFKFAPQRAWVGDFGKTGDPTDGIFARGTDNIPVPGTAGYYMIVVNLQSNQIAVVAPKVYLIGDAVGSWDAVNPAALFTVDNPNSLITLTRELAATGGGGLRMYAWFDAAPGWFTDWWQSEFIILEGNIVFRGRGDDQTRVAITNPGIHTIGLNFRTGTGTITRNP